MLGSFVCDKLPPVTIWLDRPDGDFEPRSLGPDGECFQVWRGPWSRRGRFGRRRKVPTETLSKVDLSEVRLYSPLREGEQGLRYRAAIARAGQDGLVVLDPWAMIQILAGDQFSMIPLSWREKHILTFPEIIEKPIPGVEEGLPNSRYVVQAWYYGRSGNWSFEPWMHSIQGGYGENGERHVYLVMDRKYLRSCLAPLE